jgi:hypothetical protein
MVVLTDQRWASVAVTPIPLGFAALFMLED